MASYTHSHSPWITFSRVLFIFGVLAQVALLSLIIHSYTSYDIFRGHKSIASGTLVISPGSSKERNSFTLRHLFHHGAGNPGPRARRLDITPERLAAAGVGSHVGPFSAKLSAVKIERPAFRAYDAQSPMSPMWISEDVPGPDVEDKETVLNFAYMSEDAYKVGHDDPGWLDVDEEYNSSVPFGWDDSGIRGHVFSDATNSTIILSVKGTTVAMFEGNGTSVHDKENDNLFGSCCCGQGGPYLWRKVCDCQTSTYTCDDKCVKDEIRKPNRYYAATVELFEEVAKLYPDSNVITTGHSLGGVLASLIGLQHALPSVTFETYPQAMVAKRLGLPAAGDVAPLRRYTGAFHFGHSADPVYMGTCNGASSICSIGGYAFETVCHAGKRCMYDVVKDWGWRQSTSTHSLLYAIDKVYKVYDKPAKCEDEDVECVDCFLWKYENGTHPKPTTTSILTSTATSRTRTETCKTPGWWGCRDETATSTLSGTTATITSSSSTSTCKTPGWFGCKDQTTTTISTTTSSEPTTTCTSKGWFGRCLDKVSATTTAAMERHAYWLTIPTATQTDLQ